MKDYNIHKRIFEFVIAVLQLINKLSPTATNLVIKGQIIRSVTSMGANDQEADGALTRNDFTHCFTTVRKEGKETVFWLRLTGRMNEKLSVEVEKLTQEGEEIVAIVSTIIKNASLSENKRK